MRILTTPNPLRILWRWPGSLGLVIAVALSGPAPAGATQQLGDATDALITVAEAAIRNGRPWQASEMLDSLFLTPGGRTPRGLLVAGYAAAAWGGWKRVEALLSGAPWLDSLSGEGHALLARSALERGRTNAALDHARRAVADTAGRKDGARFVTLGRAWDRLDQRDSAATAYLRAAELIPLLRDWLHLRAAGVTDDPVVRAARLMTITLPSARARLPWTEAIARDRAGKLLEAAQLYDSLGDRISGFRLRLEGTPPGARAGLRQQLIAELPGLATSDVRQAIELLDRYIAPLTPAEQLAIARRAASAGTAARAVTGFRAADQRGLLTEEDRFSYGLALVSHGQHQEGIRQFTRVTGPEWAGRAAYQAARTRMLMGRTDLAIPALRAVVAGHPADSEAAGTALYLLGDLLTDRGQDSAARAAFLELGARYPANRFSATGRLRAALTALRNGSARDAATELDMLRQGGAESGAAGYWAGRAWLALGDTVAAEARWSSTLGLGEEYYAMLSARALNRPSWTVPSARREHSPVPGLGEALARIDLLVLLGMRVEAGQEYDWINREARSGTQMMVGAARALDSAGRSHRAVRFAIRAQGQGAGTDSVLARLLYPLPHPETIQSEATRNLLDPLLVASIIRQESAFDPDATSRAGARGLMQVMPTVGVAEARTIPIEDFDPVLLYQPEVNLQLGTRHLAATMRRYSALEHALAAYNAGASRVSRWLETPGLTEDSALFVERIPIRETRDYVRRVMVNLSRYHSLYPTLP